MPISYEHSANRDLFGEEKNLGYCDALIDIYGVDLSLVQELFFRATDKELNSVFQTLMDVGIEMVECISPSSTVEDLP